MVESRLGETASRSVLQGNSSSLMQFQHGIKIQGSVCQCVVQCYDIHICRLQARAWTIQI